MGSLSMTEHNSDMTACQTIDALIARSNELGSDPRNTNYAGGNTSAKGTDTDPVTGGEVELLWVKGSGGDLGTLTEQGLATLRLDRVRADRKSTRLNSSHVAISYAVFCLKKKNK